MKVGVLVFNLGGPETLRDVKPFLYRLFSDPEIIRIKFSPLRKFVAYTIATLRRRKSEGYYAQIGGGSPIRRLTEDQSRALQSELIKRGSDAQTFVGMCAAPPFLEEAINKAVASGVRQLVILPLFPQFSTTTTGSGFPVLKRLIAARPQFKSIDVRWVREWFDHPVYIEAFSLAIQRELEKVGDSKKVHILFSAHSIPESYVRQGDPYLDQTEKTVGLIVEWLRQKGHSNSHQLSFQSKVGPQKWLSPMTSDTIVELGQKGIRDVLVVPISFVSEHSETLYELDILYKKTAADAGITNFRRVPALNSDPTFIRALADIVEGALQGAVQREDR
jgi:protoporphyrin/coproporphyrin ferrochelatase